MDTRNLAQDVRIRLLTLIQRLALDEEGDIRENPAGLEAGECTFCHAIRLGYDEAGIAHISEPPTLRKGFDWKIKHAEDCPGTAAKELLGEERKHV